MRILIEFEVFREIVQFIEELTGIVVPKGFIPIVFVLLCLIGYLIHRTVKNIRWRKKLLDKIIIGNRYGKYTIRQQRWLYINTWLQPDPPNDHDEPSQAESRDLRANTNAIKFFIKKVLKSDNNDSPFYCILGGSGMGKSTFIINLICRYIHKYNEKNLPLPINLINCGNAKSLTEAIDTIENKQSILILDALDENNEAINDYSEFYKKLLGQITPFRIVIITCRTQFFEKYEEEPSIVPVHDPCNKKVRKFKKYYISPFQKGEINRYLLKKYFYKPTVRIKAKKIVDKCTNLMARPLLLSHIDDLLKSNISDKKYSIIEIYDILIEKWLQREADFAKENELDVNAYKTRLLKFSEEMALCMAKPVYTKAETDEIIRQHNADDFFKEKNLKGRSLLNRNSKNDYKFAHKSFMEYLVAKNRFEKDEKDSSLIDPRSIDIVDIDCVSNDQIPQFWSYMIANDVFSEHNSVNIIISSGLLSYSEGIRDNRLGFIAVDGSVSDNMARCVATSCKIVAEEELIRRVRIKIDCQFDMTELIKALDMNSPIKRNIDFDIQFQNSDFQKESLCELLNGIKNYLPKNSLKSISFYIPNIDTLISSSKKILELLHNIFHLCTINFFLIDYKDKYSRYQLEKILPDLSGIVISGCQKPRGIQFLPPGYVYSRRGGKTIDIFIPLGQ
jgi:hypothetical protein